MNEKPLSKDEIAQKLLNAKYDGLSAWGRDYVDHVYSKMAALGEPKVNNDDVLKLKVASLEAENRRLRVENYDLETENEELKTELEELRAEWNPPK